MNKLRNSMYGGALGAVLALGVLMGGAVAASAQTTGSQTTPVFYQQNGMAVNPGGTTLPAGNYYNQQGQPVYYYGNGTYYNSATQTYGGTAFNSSGTAAPTSGTTMTPSGTTPVFYQNGTAVNPNGTTVPAGNYTNAQGQPVYYYGNGTYYNSATQTYGGQAFGTTPGSLGAATGPLAVANASGTPLLPNTGAGGEMMYSVLALMASLGLAAAGVFYWTRSPELN